MPLTSSIQAEYVWKTETKNSNVMDFRYNLDQPGSPSFFRPLALTATKGKVHRKKSKKKTCLYTYIHSRKTNTFTFLPQAYMENFENVYGFPI